MAYLNHSTFFHYTKQKLCFLMKCILKFVDMLVNKLVAFRSEAYKNNLQSITNLNDLNIRVIGEINIPILSHKWSSICMQEGS